LDSQIIAKLRNIISKIAKSNKLEDITDSYRGIIKWGSLEELRNQWVKRVVVRGIILQ